MTSQDGHWLRVSTSSVAARGAAILTGNLTAGERVTGTVGAGSYLVKAICLEKATGSVEVAVQPGQ